MSPEELIREQLTHLKEVLLTLKAAGATGFEGFVRLTLTELTNIPFRLATSGFQGGLDGDSALRSDTVSFEAKRYSGDIHRNEVLTKILDLARKNNSPDRLWVLAATTEIGAQLASAVQETGDQHAISTLILDWTVDPLPLLAVAAVATADATIDFLISNCYPRPDRQKLDQLIQGISKHPQFRILLGALKSSLNVSSLATARSIELNKSWRTESFGSEHVARERLGQALVVLSLPALLTLRTVQRQQVKDTLDTDHCIILSGSEGHGKSWLAAKICSDHEGLALFASAEQFDGVAPKDLDSYLIELLISQTGDISEEAVKLRWRHRFSAWKSEPPAFPLLVIVDGINQRLSVRWDQILNGLKERLQAIGGRLIVTTRPQFWNRTVAPGLTFKPKLIEVPAWSSDERDDLLKHYGISLEWLDDATLQTLRNPRLLGVAVATLPHQDSNAWKGLTTDRILMEHLRASQRENFEDETVDKLTRRLSNHAKKVLERVGASRNEPPQNFVTESNAVIETRFFRTLPGPGDTYELRQEGLTLALGYTLVDQLWQTQHSNHDLLERMTHLIDPIHAMDRTVDVMFSALMVCALDPFRFTKSIFTALLDAFSGLQNIDDQRFEEFVEIVKNQPRELFDSLGTHTLEPRRRLNQDWFTHAAFAIAASKEGWPIAEVAIHDWLHHYNADAVDQANRYPRQTKDEDSKRLRTKKEEIQTVLFSLSPFEKNLLEGMTAVTGDIDELYTLALRLLAGRPLAGFANSFISLGLGFSFDSGAWAARKAFDQLTTFNRVDSENAKEAFLKAIEPLRSTNTSQSGQWTVVRMLQATGDETAAYEASMIAQKLRKDWSQWERPTPEKWRQLLVADPEAVRPIDMDTELLSFNAINPDSILQSMGPRPEDLRFRDFLPVACRFAPQHAFEKACQIISGLLTRTAMPLRQLILNGTEYAPLIKRDIALQLITRVTDSKSGMVSTLEEREQNVQRMFLFTYAAPELTPSEQLDCMINPAFGADYLLNIIPSLKPQPTKAIFGVLQAALDSNDEEAAYGALAAMRYGHTTITSELESLLLCCLFSTASKLRALSLELAVQHDLKTIRNAHVESSWCGCTANARTKEVWFGSILLAKACDKKEISINDLLNRTHPETWFTCAKYVGEPLFLPLADHFLRRLRQAVREIKNLAIPTVDLTRSSEESTPYPFLSVDETERDATRFPRAEAFFEQFGSHEDFYEKQDRLRAISDVFFEELKGLSALLFTERVTIDNLSMLTKSASTLLPNMLETLEQASNIETCWMKNLALIVANLASKEMPLQAVALFQKAFNTEGFVTYDLGDGLTLEHEAIWSSAPSMPISSLWHQRLTAAADDKILAQEVAAAERFGASSFIKAFVEEQIDSTSALDKSYAICVAGFSNQSEVLSEYIAAHLNDKGITGEAAKKALAVQKSAQWAKKWAKDMYLATSSEEFWRYLIILKTCMDSRISNSLIMNTKWASFTPIFRTARKAAIKEQNKNLSKTLIGQNVPDRIFVTGGV
ncbi:hypothetical protein BK653_03360 [Pseudomonas brassicacearum]|uniref:hypothetical protein n=1 Tax=Pseudomonas brassicacearum TaxID=930166 RepID=UPI000F480EFB|nr:hypothetical protein [Pseudomonas brassicacearum]ROM70934.1 hypothetical protein BK653_03360 [Pseudomonas brassicacearum]